MNSTTVRYASSYVLSTDLAKHNKANTEHALNSARKTLTDVQAKKEAQELADAAIRNQ